MKGALGRELGVGTVVEERRRDETIDEARMMVGFQLSVVKHKEVSCMDGRMMMEGHQHQRQGRSSYAGSLGHAGHWAKRKTSERGEILTEG